MARQFGQPLYQHAGRRLVLTPAGEMVARFARDHDDRLARFLDELRATPTTRPIVLAAGHAAYLHILGDVIRTTLTERPGGLRLLHTHRRQMLDAVRTGRAHLGVSVLDVEPHDLTTVPVATYPQVLLVPTGHRLARRRTVRLHHLAGEELVVPPPTRPHRISLERAMRDAGHTLRVARTTNLPAAGAAQIALASAPAAGSVLAGAVAETLRATDAPARSTINGVTAVDGVTVADTLARTTTRRRR